MIRQWFLFIYLSLFNYYSNIPMCTSWVKAYMGNSCNLIILRCSLDLYEQLASLMYISLNCLIILDLIMETARTFCGKISLAFPN